LSYYLNTLQSDVHTHTEPFEDEIHPRLRFAHRGLVGMANGGAKNSNDSQFFITLGTSQCCLFLYLKLSSILLDRADELHGKHTLFGRCMGDTVYSAFHSFHLTGNFHSCFPKM
jgi:peptidyl-prolyl cis-trans isomerase SDCCAG10